MAKTGDLHLATSGDFFMAMGRLYATYRSYIEAHPEYEPFARPFSSTHGRMDVFHRTPATQLAIGWLWEDLKELGFVNGISSPNL